MPYSCWSVLKAETFRCLEESVNLDEFLRANTGGCSPLMLPTMLGLRLAEDFELGTRFSHCIHIAMGHIRDFQSFIHLNIM